MSADQQQNFDPEIGAAFTILPMTVDCLNLFLTIDKIREDDAKRVASQGVVLYQPTHQDMNAFYPQQPENQLWDLSSAPQVHDQAFNPGGVLFQHTVPPPGAHPCPEWGLGLVESYANRAPAGVDPGLFAGGAPQLNAYPGNAMAAPQRSSPALSHMSASRTNTPPRTSRASSVTPPHLNNPPVPLFPEGGNQWGGPYPAPTTAPGPSQHGISHPELPPAAPSRLPQTNQTSRQKVNPNGPMFMDVFMNTQDLQRDTHIARPPPAQQPDTRITRPPSAPQPAAGPSRLAYPLAYPMSHPMPPGGYAYVQQQPVAGPSRETGRAKTARSAPYTKRQRPAQSQRPVASPQLPRARPQRPPPPPPPPQRPSPPLQRPSTASQTPAPPTQQPIAPQSATVLQQQPAAQPPVVPSPQVSLFDPMLAPTLHMQSTDEALLAMLGQQGDMIWPPYDPAGAQLFGFAPEEPNLSEDLKDLFDSIIDCEPSFQTTT